MIIIQASNMCSKTTRLFQFGFNYASIRKITGRSSRGGPLKLQKPFPYQEKEFKWYNALFDSTILRVGEENAKLIVVEGPIAAGKTAFAKALAEELDMYYLCPPTMDEIYILPSGYDLRQHDHELPKGFQSYDHKNFCVDPKDFRSGLFQMIILMLKFLKYVDALAHILNTGQGVILERSYYSDYVFIKAMLEQKFISKGMYDIYLENYKNSGTFFLPPHLIIYLDIPIPVVQERIRVRNYSYEQNSPALTKEYLHSLERLWKQDYLKRAEKTSEILIYDWTDGGDVELIVDDIEKIDFDTGRRDKKFVAWQLKRSDLEYLRKQYTNEKFELANYFQMSPTKLPDFETPRHLYIKRDMVLRKIPECWYDEGYNPYLGDSIWKILFDTKTNNYRRPKNHLFFAPQDV